VLLALLVDEPTTHFAASELVLELGWRAIRVEDALAQIMRAGLAHRHGGFVFASRAAGQGRALLC
jgi:hypothetical protein